jgi:hypothetical protein
MTPANAYVPFPPMQGPPMAYRMSPMQPAAPALDAAPQVDWMPADFMAFLQRSFSPQQLEAIAASPSVMQALYRDWMHGGAK